MDIYTGACSAADIHRWRELCGVVGACFGDALQDLTSLPLWPSMENYPLTTATTTTTTITADISITNNDIPTCPVALSTEVSPTFQDAARLGEVSCTFSADTTSLTCSELSSTAPDSGDFLVLGATEMQCLYPELILPVSLEQEVDFLQSISDEFLRSEIFDDEHGSSSSTNLEISFYDLINTEIYGYCS
jgi:hypothetical protein